MFLKNEKGMTLVEVMVAVGILGGLAAAGVTLFKNSSKTEKTVEQNYDATAIANEIRTVLTDPTNCNKSLGGQAPNASPVMASGVTKSIAGVDHMIYIPNSELPGTKIRIVSYNLSTTYPGLTAGTETMLIIKFIRSDVALKAETSRFVKLNYTVAAGNINSCTASSSSGGGGSDLWLPSTVDPNNIYYDQDFVGVGNALPETNLDVTGWLKGYSQNTANHVYSDVYSNNPIHTPAFYARRARGTKSSPNYPVLNDALGTMTFRNHTATSGAEIAGVAAENQSVSASGTHLIFRTTLNGTTLSPDRMIINEAGNIGIGVNNPVRLLQINGPMRLDPAPLPTTNLSAGELAMDSSDNMLKYYNGTRWEAAGGVRFPKDNTYGASTAAGEEALRGQDTAPDDNYSNTAYGYQTLRNLNTAGASGNTAIGAKAGLNITNSNGNTLFGVEAGAGLDGPSYWGAWANTVIGNFALSRNSINSGGNVIVGHNAAGNGTYGGDSNIIAGANAGLALNENGIWPSAASANVLIGYNAGRYITTGMYNVVLGNSPTAGAPNNITTGQNNILIGKDIRVPVPTGSNQLNIGNLVYATGMSMGSGDIADGRIGIGTPAPLGKLHIVGTSTSADAFFSSSTSILRMTGTSAGNYIQSGLTNNAGSSADLHFSNMLGANTHFIIRANGNIEMNGAATIAQTARASSFNYTSDRRLKHAISQYKNGLNQILKLRGVEFSWSKNDKDDVGFIAQEVEKVEPRLVATDEAGFKSVKYSNILAIVVESIKDLYQQVKNLVESDAELDREIASVKKQLKEEEKLLDEQNELFGKLSCP